jgi:hypothetical protein
LRTVGLWLYKREDEEQDQEIDNDTNSNEDEQYECFHDLISPKRSRQKIDLNGDNDLVLSVNDFEENVIKSLLDEIISCVETKQSNTAAVTQLVTKQTKKRKLYEVEQESLASLAQRENKKRVLDPILEHFSWCPWLNVFNAKPVYSVFSDIVVKRLRKNEQDAIKSPNLSSKSPQIATKTTMIPTSSRLSSSPRLQPPTTSDDQTQILLNKIKSVQSLLINCTSHLSYKS